jgi:hypothetical protein
MFKWIILMVIAAIILVACQSRPKAEIVTGDLLLDDRFDSGIGWDNLVSGDVTVGVEAGAYRIRADVSSYVRGFNSELHDNVVIDVSAVQLSAERNNAYGVICRGRADNASANGYYFLIGGDGSYTIRKGQFGEVSPLVKWSRDDAINTGSATNDMRIICVDNYLALYVNGEFLVDVYDDTYHRGYAGFAVAVADNQEIAVAFDNLRIFEGRFAQ